MPQLSEADYRSVLGFVYDAGEVDGSDAFPLPMRAALASLLRADTLWQCDVHAPAPYTFQDDRVALRWGFGEGAVAGGLPPGVVEALRAYPDEDVIPAAPELINRPVRRSDVVPAREWRRRGRWAHVDRPVGARDWARLWIGEPRTPVAVFEVDNCRRDWDDRVVGMLALLAPHLRQLLRRARLRAVTSNDASCLTAREREILGLVAEGRTNGEVARILWISPHTVRTHLENTFEKLGVHTRAGAVTRVFGTRDQPSAGTDTSSR